MGVWVSPGVRKVAHSMCYCRVRGVAAAVCSGGSWFARRFVSVLTALWFADAVCATPPPPCQPIERLRGRARKLVPVVFPCVCFYLVIFIPLELSCAFKLRRTFFVELLFYHARSTCIYVLTK